MVNPPAIVKLALESICLLLDVTGDNESPDWKTIRSILNKDSFIPSIINFDTLSITYAIQNYKQFIYFFFYISGKSYLHSYWNAITSLMYKFRPYSNKINMLNSYSIIRAHS